MTRILFVDDEPNVLDGLRRMLRDMRHAWDMVFVTSAMEAINLLAKERFDIIVSDMRMPMIDGAMLLSQVRKLYPHMTRIILSGHAERQAIMKSVRLVHQYLSKPCDPEVLKRVLQQTAAMRWLLTRDDLIHMVSQIESLPPLPRSYSQLMDALDSEDATLERIGELISQDMGLTATVLKLVNSAFFGLPHQVSSPAQAVSLLGLEIIKGLVLSQGLFTALETDRFRAMSFEALWEHSQAVGCLAKRILQAEGEDKTLVDQAFIAGITHDVGKLVLATVKPEEFAGVLRAMSGNSQNIAAMERKAFGVNHGEVGAYLMGLWGADEVIVGAIALHNTPVYKSAMGGRAGRLILAAVHAANVLEHETRVLNPHYHRPTLDQGFLNEAGLLDHVARWRQACQITPEREGGRAAF